MSDPFVLSLEDVVTALYCAIDDALAKAGVRPVKGRLIMRPGTPPEVDDREILCLALLEEMLGFQSDNRFYLWMSANPTIKALFPRRLSRPNFADRRALLTPILKKLSGALASLASGSPAPFL